jgi:hypothetical protein
VDSPFRPLTLPERALLEKLLEPEFPGRDELRLQLTSVTASDLSDDGTLLRLKCGPSAPAPVRCRIPTEGSCADSDGVPIHVLLHVVDGAMHELEIFKHDSSGIINPPSPGDLELFTPYGEEGVKWGRGEPPGNSD